MQSLHHIVLYMCKYLMMASSMWQMMHTRTFEDPILDIPIVRGHGQVPHGGAPPPPPHLPISLEQLLATQNDLMRRLVENDERHGAECQHPRHQERDSSYSDFLASLPPVFADATDPLETDSWLRTMVQVRATSLYRVSKDSVCSAATQRLSWSLVGFLLRHPTC
jgi:hypothetical protein